MANAKDSEELVWSLEDEINADTKAAVERVIALVKQIKEREAATNGHEGKRRS